MPPCTCRRRGRPGCRPRHAQYFAVATSVGVDWPSARCVAAWSIVRLMRLGVDVAVGHALTDGLERADRPVELLAVGRVLGGDAQRLVGTRPAASAHSADLRAVEQPVEVAARRRSYRAASAPTATPSNVDVELRLVVHRLLALERDPAASVRHEEEPDRLAGRGRHERSPRRRGGGHGGLHAVEHASRRPRASAVVSAASRIGAELVERRR